MLSLNFLVWLIPGRLGPSSGFGRMIRTCLEYGLCSNKRPSMVYARKCNQFCQDLTHLFALFSSQVWIILAAGRPGVALDYPEHIFLQPARYVLGGKMLTRFLVKAVTYGISDKQHTRVLETSSEDMHRFGRNRITNKERPETPIR